MKKLQPERPVRVVAAILEQEDGLLVCKRFERAPRGGLWELPGGKVEPGETDQEALEREILEELGVRVRVGEPFGEILHAYSDLTIELVAYRCEIVSGTPRALGAESLSWVRADRLVEADFPEADWPLLRRLAEQATLGS